ncbi:MAG: peptidylprolyl isomerase [Sneathiella sp.]|jgi:peptidyl-prolyl cis-trans isomerase C|uniref:peptidylprolyl isomerase n=1 Tax=Sneathiella sp. TaxID=1964365 RepID=UPI000C5CB335|nr:peptidylprolyl isomerase [Sneathiella sp.]MAL78447.1 peptidylprolyl isomerase [Sneathiella sp.]
MKSLHYFALAVIAVLCLAIGYFFGAQGGPIALNEPGQIAENAQDSSADAAGNTGAQAEEDSSEVLATVNGENITEADARGLYESLPPQYRQIPMEMVKPQLVQQLVNMEVVSQAAEADKLYETESFKSKLDTARTQLLQEAYLAAKIDELVTEETLQAEYKKIVDGFTPEEEVHARHILLKTEEEAKDMIKLLDDGGDFAELAKEYSTGPSGPTGGDLGYFTKERMVPEFAEAAFNLKDGEYSKEPVKSEFGYHVIKTEGRRNTEPPKFEEMEEELRAEATNTAVDKLLEDLKADATIVVVAPPAEEKPAEETPQEGSATDGPAKAVEPAATDDSGATTSEEPKKSE